MSNVTLSERDLLQDPSRDPVVTDSDKYKVVLENDRVRVLGAARPVVRLLCLFVGTPIQTKRPRVGLMCPLAAGCLCLKVIEAYSPLRIESKYLIASWSVLGKTAFFVFMPPDYRRQSGESRILLP